MGSAFNVKAGEGVADLGGEKDVDCRVAGEIEENGAESCGEGCTAWECIFSFNYFYHGWFGFEQTL